MNEIRVILHTVGGDVVTTYAAKDMQKALDLFKQYVQSGKTATLESK